MKLVLDTGPIIALAKTGHLDLLPKLFDEVWVPEPVIGEITRSGKARPGAQIADATWARVVPVDALSVRRMRRQHDIGEGESAAILVAQIHAQDAILLIDDRRARACAT